MPQDSRTAGWIATASVFLLSAAFHTVVWQQYKADPFEQTLVADARSYHDWATRIADRGIADEPVFHQSPLFPVLLGQLYRLVGESDRGAAAIGLQILLNSAAVALLVPLGRIYFRSTRSGLAAAALALLHGPFVFHAMKLLPIPTALATQALALTALGLTRNRRRSSPLLVAAGLASGLAIVARAETLLFVPLALALFWLDSAGNAGRPFRGFAVRAVLFLAGVLFIVAPVTAHNAARGDFVLVASAGGENLFIGNQRGADGGHMPLDPRAGDLVSQRDVARLVAEQDRGRTLLPSQVSRYWRARALAEIVADPGGWLRVEGRKLTRILHPGDPTDLYSLPLERGSYLTALYVALIPPWGLLLPGIAGAALALRRQRTAWPSVAWAAIHLALLMVFFVSTRLRLPLLFFLAPPAGFALVCAAESWSAGRRRGLVAVCTAGLASLVVVGFVTTTPAPREVVRLASVLSTADRLDDALEALRPYIDVDEPDALVLDQAGWVQYKRGDLPAAREHYVEALRRELPPARAAQTRTRLAWVHEKLGELAAAAEQHDAAVSSGHADAGTYYERGMFRVRRGTRELALADFRESSRIDAAWPAPRQAIRALEER